MDSEEKTPGDFLWMSVIALLAMGTGAGFAGLWLARSIDNLLITLIVGGTLTVLGGGPLFTAKSPLKYFLLFVGCFGVGLLIPAGLALA